MDLVNPSDAAYLLAEGQSRPMNVGMLLIYDLPHDAKPDYVARLHERIVANETAAPSFRKHPEALAGVGSLAWGLEDDIDLGFHVRRAELHSPGRIGALFEMVSELHASILDRNRPLWEAYLIEGLPDARFALYLKVHRSILDCPGAMQRITQTLTVDAKDRSASGPWHSDDGAVESDVSLNSLLRSGTKKASGLAGLLPGSARQALKAIGDRDLAVPFGAPKTLFNVPVDEQRSFVGRSWAVDRMHALRDFSRAPGIDEVVLAVFSGALRSYLGERGGLPASSLVALTPASNRVTRGGVGGGDVFCRLGTDQKSPKDRLAAIVSSMESAKGLVGQTSALAWSFASMTPRILDGVPGLSALTGPPFNLAITKVPGLRDRMFWNGARLAAVYPLSFVSDGLALSLSYAATSEVIGVGVLACRRAVPDAEHLLTHMDKALSELEAFYR